MSSRVSLGEVTHREHEMLGDLGRDSVAHHYWNGRQGWLGVTAWGHSNVESEDTDRHESMVQWKGCRWWHLGPKSGFSSWQLCELSQLPSPF